MPKLVFIREGHDNTVKAQLWHMSDKELAIHVKAATRDHKQVVKTVEITEEEGKFCNQYLFFKYGKEFLGLKT